MKRRKTRYKRGMASHGSKQAQKRSSELYTSRALALPKNVSMIQIKSDDPIRLDILPYMVGAGNPFADPGAFSFERTYFVHKSVGPNNDTVVCPATGPKPYGLCPICEQVAVLREDVDADEDFIKSLKPKRRQVFNVIDTKDRKRGVQIFDISYHLFGKLLEEYLDDEETQDQLEGWCEFEGGKTLRLGLNEKTYNRQKFFEVSRINFLDRKRDYNPDRMLKQVVCLDDIIKVLPYKEIKELFLRTGESKSETSNTRSKKVKAIEKMSAKELKKFIYMNDLDVDPDEFDKLGDLREAVMDEVSEASAPSAKAKTKAKTKAKGKKAKKEEEEFEDEESEDEDEFEDEDEESEDEDESEDESEEEEFEEEEEEESEGEEEEEFEEEEEEEPAPKKKKKSTKKKTKKKGRK